MTIREKILIVEDEKSIAHFISTILTTNGYETILAKTGTEAMTMLSSHCPDLVILDLGLPAQPARLVEPAGRRGVRAHA